MMDDGEGGGEKGGTGRLARCAIFRRSEEARGFFFRTMVFFSRRFCIHACFFFLI